MKALSKKQDQKGLIVSGKGWIRNVLYDPRDLNAWSPVDGTIWGHVESVALLEEACH